MNWLHLKILIFFFAFGIETGKIRLNFNEIFGNEWDKSEKEENSEENGIKTIAQMANDQNIIKSDQNTKEEPNDQQKRKTIQIFEAIKEKLKQKGKYNRKNSGKIETKIAKLLGANRHKIYKWKKELNLNKIKMKKMKNSFYEEKKREFIESFDGFKRIYGDGKQKEFAKEFGISERTFLKWKKELMPKYHKMRNKYSNEQKLKKMKQYFEIKETNPKISDEIIAKKLEIGNVTLHRWKKICTNFNSVFF